MARLSKELVNQALHLARREPKRPKEASLRRAISASYYALFHFLIEEATRRVVGGVPRVAPLRELVGRAFVHGKMKTLCSEFLKPNHRLLRALPPPFAIVADPDLHAVCRAFVDLQEKRHIADYDLTASFSRAQAL